MKNANLTARKTIEPVMLLAKAATDAAIPRTKEQALQITAMDTKLDIAMP